jgi:uncharacterized surface protein with fasciclin (FAS1) repeats
MMKNFTLGIIVVFVIAIFAGISCKDSLDKKTFFTTDKLTVAQRLELSPDTFSMYVEILNKTNYFNAFKSYGNYTCFAPSNDAVLKYITSQWKVTSVAQLTTADQMEALKLIVKFHTMPTRKLTSVFKEGRLADTTYTGDYLTTSFAAGGGIQNVLINKTTKIVRPDLNMDNGVIHVIDRVMDPFIDPVPVVMDKSGKYKIFVQAMKQTGYFSTFSQIYNDIHARKYFTIVAESDSVYKLSNINSFSELAKKFSAGYTDYTNVSNGLNRFVAYHVMSSFFYTSDFPADGFVSTVLTNNAIKSLKSGNILKLNETETGINDTWLSLIVPNSNNPARNGVYHNINGLMDIFVPRAKYIIFDVVSDQPEVQSKAVATSAQVLSTAYQYVRWYPEGTHRFLTYATNQTPIALNNNIFDLGGKVWYEFDTPVIPKGKYTLTVCSGNAGNAARGIWQVYWDGQPLGSLMDLSIATPGWPDSTAMEAKGWRHGLKRVANQIGSAYDQRGACRFVVTKELLCPVQQRHVIHFEAAKSGGIPLDYIEWIPVN